MSKSKLLKQTINFLAAARREDHEIARRNLSIEEMASSLGFKIDWSNYQLVPVRNSPGGGTEHSSETGDVRKEAQS